MIENKYDYDEYFKNLGLIVLANAINKYLATNNPTEDQRKLLQKLYEDFPDFREEKIVYRAVKNKIIPRYFRNKYVGGCSSLEEVLSFVKKRHDKGYEYILVSNEPIECFNLHKFINFINEKYGKVINDWYQDEKEVIFKMKKGIDWYKMSKIDYTKLFEKRD